ncbi:MAG: hypothetical protein NDI90_19510 [Nitrospira sp. BO4]|jgi:hypothetical protein|nr:hypothetical protein [Nitrospira sp. BO4]
MTTTVKYCSRCAGLLSLLSPRNENEIRFYWAGVRQIRPAIHKGQCEKCGRTESLTYYRFPG